MQQPEGRGRRRNMAGRAGRPLRRRSRQPQPRQEQQQEPLRVTSNVDYDKDYFESYAQISAHEELLKDTTRTEAYKNAIMRHKDFIRGKVVLDVGCGTGILAIFCAQAGAKRVYAVEASDIAMLAYSVIADNNLSNVVTVLQGRIEDLVVAEKVDVIVSEWMGYMLFSENMLASVITARDRWLKPEGLILPSQATLYMAPFTNPKRYGETVDFWNNVYGINMSAMVPLAKYSAFAEPCVETITAANILAWPQVVKCVNCASVTIPELESVTTRFEFKSVGRAPIHGFAFWFDVEFRPVLSAQPINFILPTSSSVDIDPVDSQTTRDPTLKLTTAPSALPTHWQQTLIYLYNPIELEQDQNIEGKVTLSQNLASARFLDIEIEYILGGQSYVKMSFLR